MSTINEILKLSAQFLGSRREAEEVIALALNCSRLNLYMLFDQPLNVAELERCREVLRRRSKGEPLAYIRGEVEFYQCKIKINSSVLIPRQETEILVDLIAKKDLQQVQSVWDICCGSGAIGISLKKCRPEISITLSDLSLNALQVVNENAQLNEIDVELLQGDFLNPFQGRRCDLIVCNPPYVTNGEWDTLDKSVKDFEPKIALIGGEDGLDFYRRLAMDGKGYLNENGIIWLEIGTGQGERVKELFSTWKECAVMPDWAGHDRFVRIIK